MMQVDLKKCTGCGDCLDICPVEAISMDSGKARIDPETCLECEACARVCPVEAIYPSAQPVPVEVIPSRSIAMRQPAMLERPAPHPAVPWTKAALTFAGREILPRVVDVVMGALERRLSQPEVSTLSSTSQTATPRARGPTGRQRRRRKRGGFRT